MSTSALALDPRLDTRARNAQARAMDRRKFSMDELDRRLSHPDVHRRFLLYTAKGLSIGDGERAPCTPNEALEEAVYDVFYSGPERQSRPMIDYCTDAHVARLRSFIEKKKADDIDKIFVPEGRDLAVILKKANEAQVMQTMVAEQRGQNEVGAPRKDVQDLLFKKLAALRAAEARAAEAEPPTDEEVAEATGG